MLLQAFSEPTVDSSEGTCAPQPRVRIVPRIEPFPVLSELTPQWADSALRQMDSLVRLSSDWDTYGASPIRLSRIQQAYSLLQSIMDDRTPAPSLVPTIDGSIQIEWHAFGIELEVHLLSDAELDVGFEDLVGTEPPFDEILTYDVTHLRKFMHLLTSRARESEHA